MKAELRQFAKEIGVDEADRFTMQMVECGLHSGFPKCCVAFFVKIWWPYTLAIDGLSYRAQTNAYVAYDDYQIWSTRPGYVACPRCVLEKNFVETLPCDCELKRLSKSAASRRGR